MSRPLVATDRSPLLRHTGKVAAALAAYEGVQKINGSLRGYYNTHYAYTVTVHEGDHLYGDVHAWLLSLMPEDRQRALVVATRYRGIDSSEPSDGTERLPFELLFDDKAQRRVEIDGHPISVEVAKTEVPADARRMPETSIIFRSRTKAGQAAVLSRLRAIHDQKSKRKPVLRIVNQWGNWTRRSDLPLRDLGSVILPEQQKTAIVEDLRDFLDAEPDYNRLALPWHRGYLFHGPPGTGKTSLVKALANEFNLDLWYVSLGDLKEEASLINLLAEVGPRSLLLLEDIDTVQLTHDRAEVERAPTGKSINLSSLLNALDGVATPHGLISVMTTNHFELLDSALTRAGRMDRIEELTLPTWREVDQLYRRFYRDAIPWGLDLDVQCPLSQAEVSEIFKRHFHDPAGSLLALAPHAP